MFAFNLKRKLAFLFGDKRFIKQLLWLFFPAIIQNIVISTISYVDNFFLATHTPDNLGIYTKTAAILANQVLYLPTIFTVAVCFGIGIMSSQYKGLGDQNKFKETILWMFVLCWLINIPFFIAYFGFPQWVISTYAGNTNNLVTENNQETLKYFQQVNNWASVYLRLVMIAHVFYLFSFPLALAHRYDGAPIIPLVGSLSALVTNLILNPLFLLVIATNATDAIILVGVATIIARIVDLAIILVCMLVRKNKLTYIFNYHQLHWQTLLLLLRYGWHIMINESLFSIAVVCLSLFLYKFYPNAREGIATALLVSQFTKLIWPGMSTTVGVLVLAKLGQNQIDLAKKHSKHLLFWSLVFGFVLAILLFSLSLVINPFLNQPVDDSWQAINKAKTASLQAMYMEWILVIEIMLIAPYAAMNNCIRGSGRKLGSISDTSIMLVWLLMIGLLTTYLKQNQLNPIALFALIEANWLIKLISVSFLFKLMKWANHLVKKQLSWSTKSNVQIISANFAFKAIKKANN